MQTNFYFINFTCTRNEKKWKLPNVFHIRDIFTLPIETITKSIIEISILLQYLVTYSAVFTLQLMCSKM